jgi:hypothetical protein
MDVRNDAPPPQWDPRGQPPVQPPQMPDFQPPNGPPFGRMPRNMPRGNMRPGNIPPGNNRPPDGNPGQKWPVLLSNGRVGAGVGFRRTITISYRFEEGEPAPGQFYFVVIKSPNSHAEAQINSLRMAKEGTFNLREIGFAAQDDGPFEAHLETGMPGPFGQREVISNTIKLSQ